jgi:hypothetical protein
VGVLEAGVGMAGVEVATPLLLLPVVACTPPWQAGDMVLEDTGLAVTVQVGMGVRWATGQEGMRQVGMVREDTVAGVGTPLQQGGVTAWQEATALQLPWPEQAPWVVEHGPCITRARQGPVLVLEEEGAEAATRLALATQVLLPHPHPQQQQLMALQPLLGTEATVGLLGEGVGMPLATALLAATVAPLPQPPWFLAAMARLVATLLATVQLRQLQRPLATGQAMQDQVQLPQLMGCLRGTAQQHPQGTVRR